MAALIRAVADSIPTDPAAVFKAVVAWDVFDAAGSSAAAGVRRWVGKKLTELLGEEEASLVDYVMGHLERHVTPAELVTEVGPVLDEEAESFVLKLWRALLFEVGKARRLATKAPGR